MCYECFVCCECLCVLSVLYVVRFLLRCGVWFCVWLCVVVCRRGMIRVLVHNG